MTEKNNPEKLRKLLQLLRAYTQLQAEYSSLASILTYVETQGHLPTEGWLATLKEMRLTPEYRRISEQYESLFLRAEQSLDVNEAEQLIATMPSAQILN